MKDHAVIAVSTYHRPDELGALLASLRRLRSEFAFEVLVIDNDPSGGAESIAREHVDRYVVESRPGIVATRNRALAEAGNARWLIFVDDDETVDVDWLDALISHQLRSGADVVYGSVQTILPSGTPDWVRRGKFIQRRALTTGERLKSAATNNVLMRMDAWRRVGSPQFDLSFSSTGGSDSDFFSRMYKAGLRIEGCAEAIVYEPVSVDRVTPRWLARRATRNGVVLARLWRRDHSILAVGAKGALFFVQGAISQLSAFAGGRGLQAGPFNRMLNGVGVLAAIFGLRLHEYRRVDG